MKKMIVLGIGSSLLMASGAAYAWFAGFGRGQSRTTQPDELSLRRFRRHQQNTPSAQKAAVSH